MLAALKTLLTFMLAGALLGGIVASWLGPRYLEWDNTAPLGTQTVCNLPVVIRDVSSQLLSFQFYGMVAGALGFVVLGVLYLRTQARRQKQPPAPPSPAPPPAA